MSAEERSLLALDLKHCFDQLRSLPAPLGLVYVALEEDHFRCFRIAFDPVGPFATEPDFYRYLCGRSYLQAHKHLEEFGCKVHAVSHRICLSHNDFASHDTLINSKLSAIIDWECAAWLPEYWDYTRSYFLRDSYHEWLQLMAIIFGVWPEELRVEREMWKYNDPH